MNHRIRSVIGAATAALQLLILADCQRAAAETVPFFPAREAPNYECLVSASWLKVVHDFHESDRRGPRPPSYRKDRFVVLEASWAPVENAADFLRGHIPGAIHINTDDLENGYPTWKLRTTSELHEVIGRHGITPDTTVIVYGRQLVAAARVWWILKYAGVADVRLLDGGFEHWSALGFPRETTLRHVDPVSFAARVNTHLLATAEYVRTNLNSGQVCLADARTEAEFAGRVSGYEYLDCRGRIPGAIPIGNAGDESGLYQRSNGRLRDPVAVEALWKERGLVAADEPGRFDREVIFYCGGGWRSSVTFFYAWLLGYQNTRNYSEGWSGWSTVYVGDATAKGRTPGWRQERTDHPIAVSATRSGGVTGTARGVASAVLLLVLLLWESMAPYFPFFVRVTPRRIGHGLRNLALGAMNAVLNGLLCIGLWWVVAQWALDHSIGLLHWIRMPLWAHWIAALLLLDLWMYLWHRLNHRVPFFWRFHQVHHSDPRMDVTTASRFHFGEIAFSCVLRVPVIAVIGLQLHELAVYEMIAFAVVQVHHANIRLPGRLDHFLRWVIVTPFMHKVHHSNWKPETDSNYASLFSFWDRLFHTYRARDEPQTLRFGLEELSADEQQTLGALLVTPTRRIERPPPAGAEPTR